MIDFFYCTDLLLEQHPTWHCCLATGSHFPTVFVTRLVSSKPFVHIEAQPVLSSSSAPTIAPVVPTTITTSNTKSTTECHARGDAGCLNQPASSQKMTILPEVSTTALGATTSGVVPVGHTMTTASATTISTAGKSVGVHMYGWKWVNNFKQSETSNS